MHEVQRFCSFVEAPTPGSPERSVGNPSLSAVFANNSITLYAQVS